MNATEKSDAAHKVVVYFYAAEVRANEPVTFLHWKKRATVTVRDVTPITKQKYRACVRRVGRGRL